jgi:FtsH-binding integral membrane protein
LKNGYSRGILKKNKKDKQRKELTMQSIPLQRTQTQILVNEFVRSVYNWMAVGLGLTGLVAFYVANSPAMLKLIFGNKLIFFGLIIGELALVFSISARVNKMRASTATGLFLLYAALNGATLSVIFLMYTASSITSTFFICAATFVACSVYGMTTKRDLTSFGGFLMMGLIGIIIASLVNMFMRSSGMSMIISYIGVIVFVGLTAYDTQKLKTMALSQPAGLDAGVVRKGAILGALSLYLDFINLFLMLLRIFGSRR